MFYLAPLALIALVGLAADGVVPRRRRPVLAAAAIAGVLPVFIPFTALHHDERGLRHLRAAALVVGAGPPDLARAGALGRARRLARRRPRSSSLLPRRYALVLPALVGGVLRR